MRIQLLDIPDVKPAWQTVHRVKALQIDGDAPAVIALAEWKRTSPADYRKILKAIARAAGARRVFNTNHVKKIAGYEYLYELRAHQGSARLLFFYSDDADEIIICANPYWKAKSSSREQEAAFKRCEFLRNCYGNAKRAHHRSVLEWGQ